MEILSLIPLADIVRALEQVETVELRGTVYIATEDALDVFQQVLTRAGAVMAQVPTAAGPAPREAAADAPLEVPSASSQPVDGDLEAERARLAALPPGPCVGCGKVHPSGPSETGCDDYVDRTVRDPIQHRIDSGQIGGGAVVQPMYQPEPVFDPGSRLPPGAAPAPQVIGGPVSVPEYDPTPQGPVIG